MKPEYEKYFVSGAMLQLENASVQKEDVGVLNKNGYFEPLKREFNQDYLWDNLKNEQEYPCVGTYMVEKKDGKYYVMSPSEITDELRTQAATDYAKFMTTDSYKSYTKAYNVFIKKNPGYEEKIANKLGAE